MITLDGTCRCKDAVLQSTSQSDQIPYQNIVFTQADYAQWSHE